MKVNIFMMQSVTKYINGCLNLLIRDVDKYLNQYLSTQSFLAIPYKMFSVISVVTLSLKIWKALVMVFILFNCFAFLRIRYFYSQMKTIL